MTTTPTTPVVAAPGCGEVATAGPTRSLIKVGSAATGGRLSAVEMHLQGGWSGPPPHVHGTVDHLWWVLAGAVRLTVGSEAHACGPGSCVYVPAHVVHGFSTADSDGATLLQVDSPRALDGYFRDLAAAFPPDRPVDPAAVAAIMRRHDTQPVRVA